MRKLQRKDIRGPALYAPIRDDLRRRIIELKKRRRIEIGPFVTVVFENRQTMIFQTEEMLRAEGIVEEAKILEEIEVYNALLPNDGELAATLLVEITEEKEIRPTLERLVGLDEHLFLEVDGQRVKAQFEPGRSTEEKISSVQYVRFAPTPAQAEALRRAETPLALAIEHPSYRHRVTLAEATRAELAADLD
jgi:hypothetical protein